MQMIWEEPRRYRPQNPSPTSNAGGLSRSIGGEFWWYDPINQQHVILGTFAGDFLAQAQFTLRGQGIEALEIPYQVNRAIASPLSL
jgi:hypothetical protein